MVCVIFFFSSRRRHTRYWRDWSSDVCSSDLRRVLLQAGARRRINRVVPDAKGEDATKDLRVTTEADIGSYVAVPLMLSDGRLFGTLCCVGHAPDPWLRERDLVLMGRVARQLIEQLERHGRL